jgi:hypothetical protein
MPIRGENNSLDLVLVLPSIFSPRHKEPSEKLGLGEKIARRVY